MSSLTIGWEYLTGRCVATDPASRQRTEWPPHPARVFMALAAAWFETGEDEAEGQTLRWIEQLGDPELRLPPFHSNRDVVDCYVPVNDVAGPSKAILQSAPGFTRERKERTFPSVWVGDAPCFLHWANIDDAAFQTHRSPLDQLCAKVTRIGHSSSLVRMWVADDLSATPQSESWIPNDGLADLQARRVGQGTLDLLDRQFNRRGREQYAQLEERISTLKTEKPVGKGAKDRKASVKVELESLEQELMKTDARDPVRPKIGLWTGYSRAEAQPPPSIAHTEFDSDLLILTQIDGPRLPLTTSLSVTQAMRGAIMAHIGSSIPEWISGHKHNNEPLRNGNQQMAYIPLAFVGSEYSDGHLLGAALVFPRSVPRRVRSQLLGSFLLDDSGQPKPVPLHSRYWRLKLIKRDWNENRRALQPESWTAHPHGATTWATVTPIVLDRFTKSDPVKERDAWNDEVARIITTSCLRLGLPDPDDVAVSTTCWHLGSPRSTTKRRPLRGHQELIGMDTALGDGFPIYPTKSGNGARPQLHVFLRFPKPVVGPILLCAGRFLGYGLCKPLKGESHR